jgi:TolB protein
MVVAGLVVAGCLVAAIAGGVLLVQNVPGVARLVYGDPPSATPLPTLRATFTPLVPLATLTSAPTATDAVTPTATPTATPSPVDTVASGTDTQDTAAPATTTPLEEASATASATPSPVAPTETPTPVPPTPAPRPEWIAFESDRGELGDYEIFVMATDGSRLSNLTNSWADDVAPIWSPDGRKIAFVSFRDTLSGRWNLGAGAICVMDFDPVSGVGGGNVRCLTDKAGKDGWPTWSPDSQRIAFESNRGDNWDIWVINTDGTGLANLTQSPEDELFPAWSPDGQQIAFTSKRSGNLDVWVMNRDGSNPRNLTRNPSRDRYAMWSPDGTKIAFNTSRDGDQEIYVMNADGSNPTNVSRAPNTVEGLADWSPDGQRMVLYSDRPGNKDVFIVDLASGQWTNLTQHPASDEFCSWSP